MPEPSHDPIVIRQARPDDADRIVQITVAVFAPVSIDAMIDTLLGQAGEDWRQIKGRTVRAELVANSPGCFVAELGGRIVGYVTNSVDRAASRGRILNIAVDAAAQGKGIGRRLLEHSLDYFRREGLAQAKIETLACNDVGQRLYPSLGFRELVRQIHYVMPLK